jgi:hypothetical protein
MSQKNTYSHRLCIHRYLTALGRQPAVFHEANSRVVAASDRMIGTLLDIMG